MLGAMEKIQGNVRVWPESWAVGCFRCAGRKGDLGVSLSWDLNAEKKRAVKIWRWAQLKVREQQMQRPWDGTKLSVFPEWEDPGRVASVVKRRAGAWPRGTVNLSLSAVGNHWMIFKKVWTLKPSWNFHSVHRGLLPETPFLKTDAWSKW